MDTILGIVFTVLLVCVSEYKFGINIRNIIIRIASKPFETGKDFL